MRGRRAGSPLAGVQLDRGVNRGNDFIWMRRPTSQDVRDVFVRRGLRCTRQRGEIYSALVACGSHPTAEELYQDVRRSSAGLSLATVYNTLEALSRSGLCRRLAAAGSGAARYDGDLSHHLHVVTADGRVLDIPDELGDEVLSHLPEELIGRISTAMGVPVERASISFIAAGPGVSPCAGCGSGDSEGASSPASSV